MIRRASHRFGNRCAAIELFSGYANSSKMYPLFSTVAGAQQQQHVAKTKSDPTNGAGRVQHVSVPMNHNRGNNKELQLDAKKSFSHGNKKPHHHHQHKANKNSHLKNKGSKNKPNHSSNLASPNLSTEWVSITNIPPLSTIDDLLVDIERIMKTELAMGIVDLDLAQEILKNIDTSPQEIVVGQPQLPLWEPDESLPSHLVIEAHLMLSTLKRPTGWFLRFPNRSCVHALLSHIDEAAKAEKAYRRMIKENGKDADADADADADNIPPFSWNDLDTRPLMCAWKKVSVAPFHIKNLNKKDEHPFFDKLKFALGDNVVRVENCSRDSDIDDVKYFLNRYDLLDDRDRGDKVGQDGNLLKSVERVVQGRPVNRMPNNKSATTPSTTNTFLVTFASAADARSSVREKQNVEFMGRRLRLAQYSRQIFRQES